MDEEISKIKEEILGIQFLKHQKTIYTKCIYCNPLLSKQRKHPKEFRKFWKILQQKYSALLITKTAKELFKEIQHSVLENKENLKSKETKEKVKELIENIAFSKTKTILSEEHFT